MLGPETIKQMSDVAAYRAAEEGRYPLSIWKPEDVRGLPFLGDYVPAGWRYAIWSDFYQHPRNVWPREDERAHFMVDSSGFGSRDEPALTPSELGDFVMLPQRPQHEYGWAIVEAGQFQIVVQAYVRDETATGTEAPDRESVECEYCHEVHGPFEECDPELLSRCPACGDVIDYCRGHGEIGDATGFAILKAHDEGIHTDCHGDGCDDAGGPCYGIHNFISDDQTGSFEDPAHCTECGAERINPS